MEGCGSDDAGKFFEKYEHHETNPGEEHHSKILLNIKKQLGAFRNVQISQVNTAKQLFHEEELFCFTSRSSKKVKAPSSSVRQSLNSVKTSERKIIFDRHRRSLNQQSMNESAKNIMTDTSIQGLGSEIQSVSHHDSQSLFKSNINNRSKRLLDRLDNNMNEVI